MTKGKGSGSGSSYYVVATPTSGGLGGSGGGGGKSGGSAISTNWTDAKYSTPSGSKADFHVCHLRSDAQAYAASRDAGHTSGKK